MAETGEEGGEGPVHLSLSLRVLVVPAPPQLLGPCSGMRREAVALLSLLNGQNDQPCLWLERGWALAEDELACPIYCKPEVAPEDAPKPCFCPRAPAWSMGLWFEAFLYPLCPSPFPRRRSAGTRWPAQWTDSACLW